MLNPVDEENLSNMPSIQRKNRHVFFNCLPETLRNQLEITSPFSFRQWQCDSTNPSLDDVFGPAATALFGLSTLRNIEISKSGFEDGYTTKAGSGLSTVILQKWVVIGCGDRAYFDTLARRYNISAQDLPDDFRLSFQYPVPDTDRNLQLMRISSLENLVDEYLEYYQIKEGKEAQLRKRFLDRPYRLIYLHPNCNQQFYDDLISSLNPLFAILDQPAEEIGADKTPSDEKLDALSTIYWLVAQSTPVIRGGSALANIILHHMAHRLREQGYEYDIPFTKTGVDLWAEATILPIEDTEQIEGFKTCFKDGPFFSPETQAEDVELYLTDGNMRNRPTNNVTSSLALA
ncbi:MAG: hypothetical protein COV36_00565 [Alphaproteobacteria bacterium CG11_big_fil_rev_8_21_14_0_20_44_7]|nr:MAG: hypothetical protein COV36_00565 [Alphaproteobacteria bacterium CG11_big_fil_rev_8_21_14_0_20_44_7]